MDDGIELDGLTDDKQFYDDGLPNDDRQFYDDGLPTNNKQFYDNASLSDDKLFYIDGQEFRTLSELAEYMRRLLDSSLIDFKRLCHKLVDFSGELDAQFSAWLAMMGKSKELDEWRASINELI